MKDILTHATTWMNLEVSELSQKQKDSVSFHLYEVPRVVKFIEQTVELAVARGWGLRTMGAFVEWVQSFSFDRWKTFRKRRSWHPVPSLHGK